MNTERQLLSLINATQVLTSTLDLDIVLDKLIEEVLNVIEGADAGVFFMYDKKSNRMVAKNAIGYDMQYLQKIQLRPDEGMTGKTFTSKKARIFFNSAETMENMADMLPENKAFYSKSVGRIVFPASAVCAPLIDKDAECIGILTVVSFLGAHFTNKDLKLLETFAMQSVIAIENAKLFSQNERSKKIYEALSLVSLSKRGLNEVTETLSNLVNKKVCICNEFFDLLASSSLQTKHLSEQLMKDHYLDLKQAMMKEKVTLKNILLDGEELKIYYFPIKVDKSNKGLLIVFVEDDTELDPLNLFAIEQANIIFALEISGQEKLMADHFRFEGYLLDQLLQNKFHEYTSRQRSQGGIMAKEHYVCCNLELIDPLLTFEELNRKKQEFNRLIYRELNYYKYRTLVLEKNLHYTFLFITDDKQNEEKILDELEMFFLSIFQKSRERNVFDFYVGIGRLFKEMKEIQISYRDTTRCVQYLIQQDGKRQILRYKELGPYWIFLHHNQSELLDYVNQTVGQLIEYDHQYHTELLSTLKVFIESNQNMKKTSEMCYVHTNTIKYRLQTIKKILSKDELDGKDLFELQLAIYMYEYVHSS